MILSTRIDDLINAIGGPTPPDYGAIKSELVTLSRKAKTLENRQSTAKLEAKIADLEATLKLEREAFETERQEHQTQLRNLTAELDAANKEIEKLTAPLDKLPDIEERILVALPDPKAAPIGMSELSAKLGLDRGTISHHVDRLIDSRHIEQHKYPPVFGGRIVMTGSVIEHGASEPLKWNLSRTGNAYVYALKLSGEYDKYKEAEKAPQSAPKAIKARDLAARSVIEVKILKYISSGGLISASISNTFTAEVKAVDAAPDAVMIAIKELERLGFLQRASAGLRPYFVLTSRAKAWLERRDNDPDCAFG